MDRCVLDRASSVPGLMSTSVLLNYEWEGYRHMDQFIRVAVETELHPTHMKEEDRR
jgi:hypothetical protein